MTLRLKWGRMGGWWGVLVVLALFAGCGLFRSSDVDGDDLASSYVGCRLVGTGQTAHLYSHDPVDFAALGEDDAWQTAADEGGFEGFLHPYVQTPLWAYALGPICGQVRFRTFEWVFAVLTMLSFAGCIGLVGWFWTPELLDPLPIGVVVAVLWFSEPFGYAVALMQTHVLFLLLTIASLILAERRRPGWAGLLLACAAAVKITPGVLVIYWLLTRRWKAAMSAALWSCVLVAATLAATGEQTFAAYLADLHRVSRVLLLSQNNQSFAAWWMGRFYPPSEVFGFRMHALPGWLRVGSTALMIACTAAGGLLDRRSEDRGAKRAPMGAMIALLAATMFAPIAWTHYSIVLIAPLMMLAGESRRLRSWWLAGAVLSTAALNLRPLATDVQSGTIARFSLLRSHFYAEALCVVVLGVVAWRSRRMEAVTKRSDRTVILGQLARYW